MYASTRFGIVAVVLLAGAGPVYAGDFLASQLAHARVAEAHAEKATAVRDMFRSAGAEWPPTGLFLRAFKYEGELEAWAPAGRRKPWVRVAKWPICKPSGTLGPKRWEGDGQVPEGVYLIDRFNPRSAYHLSMGLDYPNSVDRHRAGPGRSAGSDIFVHGGCVTVGCLPMTNRVMEYLYLSAVYARHRGKGPISIHIFPCRFGSKGCEKALSESASIRSELRVFWNQLRPIYRVFQRTHIPPKVETTRRGRYRLIPRRTKASRGIAH